MAHTLWFKAKRYGWGWYPATWQGWLVTLTAVGLILINTIAVDRMSPSASDTLIGSFILNVLIIAALIGICVAKGEKPKWRWGGKD